MLIAYSYNCLEYFKAVSKQDVRFNGTSLMTVRQDCRAPRLSQGRTANVKGQGLPNTTSFTMPHYCVHGRTFEFKWEKFECYNYSLVTQ